MTESVMAVPSGSPVGSADGARVRRTRTRARVAATEGNRKIRAAGVTKVARQVVRVMWRDASGAWFTDERGPSMRTVWRTDFTAHLSDPWPPYTLWCRVWRYPGAGAAVWLDAKKWLAVHPVRGPLFLAARAGFWVAVLLQVSGWQP